MKKDKLSLFKEQTLLTLLPDSEQAYLIQLHKQYRFSLQEFKFLTEAARDLFMWQSPEIKETWGNLEKQLPDSSDNVQRKKKLIKNFRLFKSSLDSHKEYPNSPAYQPRTVSNTERYDSSDKNIFGRCPVYSDKTLCCGLYTLDSVENCPFRCSYCSIQTFYEDAFIFQKNLEDKLNQIEIKAEEKYHIGTGQSSDALVWGNKDGLLDKLCGFAEKHQNVLLEFKTKSDNIQYFLENAIPKNIVCSWTLNTPVIIEHEEHLTATLDQRLKAARKVADKGIRIAFHFHPIISYKDCETDYQQVAEKVIQLFKPEEVPFITFGSLTLIKPAIKAIRKEGNLTKILQMPFSPDPHGKPTYPDQIKIRLFKTLYETFSDWHKQVYFYFCMEKPEIWEQVFGSRYKDNTEFSNDFFKKVCPWM